MVARRSVFALVVVLCALACVLVCEVAPAGAVTQFGSEGSGAGELQGPGAVAINQSSGDVYVQDEQNRRIDEFSGAGDFLRAWGWGVDEEDPLEELQVCTTGCQTGLVGSEAGEFNEGGAGGVAVDPSSGDLYVVDHENYRVEKFDSSGKFLLMFGGGVNKATGGDVCVAGEACGKGVEGSLNGEFEWAYGDHFIAMGSEGRVYVGDRARIEVFEPSGLWRENISLTDLSATGKVTALAIDSAGDMFVKIGGGPGSSEGAVPGVHELEPNGTVTPVVFDAGSEAIKNLAVSGSDELFIEDSAGGVHILKYDSAGKELASFASKILLAPDEDIYIGGMAFADTLGDLYVSGSWHYYIGNQSSYESKILVLSPPPPGPLIESDSVSATPGEHGVTSVEASVNPEGYETSYRVEYVDDAHFQADGFVNASSTSSVSLGSGSEEFLFEDYPAVTALSGLTPGVKYDYRVVASNAKGTTSSPVGSFEEIPAALVDGPWVTDVASTSATFGAGIDPLGASTEYRLEYGTSTAYGHVLTGNVGEGRTSVFISYHRQELEPGMTYHYRLVTVNAVGTIDGADHMFVTQPAGGNELTLPDERAWELVSPANKNGALLSNAPKLTFHASADGTGITYQSEGPAMGEDLVGNGATSQILSAHGPDGWNSEDITLPQSPPPPGEAPYESSEQTNGEYHAFSTDLSSAIASPGLWTSPYPGGPEYTLYLRDNTKGVDADGSAVPLVSPAPGTEFKYGEQDVGFVAATPDLSHVILSSRLALTPEAHEEISPSKSVPADENLYEWDKNGLGLVNVLPDGKSFVASSGGVEARLAGKGEEDIGGVARAVSSDGHWVAWTIGDPYGESAGSYRGLFIRDTTDGRTVRLGGGRQARYQTMSSNGSRVFYLENGDLYEYVTGSGVVTDLTSDHGVGEANAGVHEMVSNVSEDGSYVYFVATGVLANGGVSGEDNLYVLHESYGAWTTRLVATLSPEDVHSWYGANLSRDPKLSEVRSRVSPDGRYLAFMSDRSLTGYDNVDAATGQPDEEVYLYDAVADRVVCASCDPTGARPIGGTEGVAGELTKGTGNRERIPFAGIIPGWQEGNDDAYQPRYLADSGRLFFDSPDALVPQDTNGLEDVYEYEPSRGEETVASDNCTSSSTTFSERSDGCVSLISSGTSSSESVFLDASETGDDVFFLTTSKLTSEDYDTGYDVYDAHVCSGAAPCVAVPVSSPPCTSGDSCKAAPSPQPELFGPAPSATFSGTGNVVEEPKSAVKHKANPKKRTKKKRKKKKSKAGKTGRSRAGRASGKGGR